MNTKEQLIELLLGELKSNSIYDSSTLQTKSENRLLRFTEKEIIQMPKTFRKTFRAQGCTAHVRKRTDGRYICSYEIRYAKRPYDKHPISASGTTLEEAKARFIEKLNNYVQQDDTAPTIPSTFDRFAIYWFENFHKRKVAEKTYKKNFDTYKRDIQKVFNQIKLTDMSPVQIQKFLDGFSTKERTKETLHSILNQIFKCAVKHGVIKLNPLDMCFYKKHEREHGVAISKDNENKLLNAYKNTEFELDFAIILYTGLRPCEYKTAIIDGRFIKSQNCKRKGGKIEHKRIPISPMLEPYLNGVTEIKLHHPVTIDKRFKKLLPNHTLKDMRTTFQTRLDECGIPDKVIGIVMGNTIGKGDRIKETYTDVFSQEYQEYLYKWMQHFKY
ncbi:MAG: integrase [Caudoviricetes sp.]|nr:MAG: integrase [Caudoviricetes sp.]